MAITRARITSLGCYVPPNVITNADLEKLVETNNEWIVSRTGISERHVASPEMATSDLATSAAKIALEKRGIPADDLDAIIVCTVTPDMMFPSTACLVQNNLGAKHAWGFDLIAACSGFIYGINTAANLVMAGSNKKVLVIGADTMTRILNYEDRATCVLFGDGTGAVLIEAADPAEPDLGFIDFMGEIDGSGGQFLYMPGGGSRRPASHDTVDRKMHYVHQEGQQVFKYAITKMLEYSRAILARNGFSIADLALLVPHQANMRIVQA